MLWTVITYHIIVYFFGEKIFTRQNLMSQDFFLCDKKVQPDPVVSMNNNCEQERSQLRNVGPIVNDSAETNGQEIDQIETDPNPPMENSQTDQSQTQASEENYEELELYESVPAGLINSGSYSFLISVLQMLTRCREIYLFMENMCKADEIKSDCVKALSSVMQLLHMNISKQAILPKQFIIEVSQHIDIVKTSAEEQQQEDAVEFLQLLLRYIGGVIKGIY